MPNQLLYAQLSNTYESSQPQLEKWPLYVRTILPTTKETPLPVTGAGKRKMSGRRCGPDTNVAGLMKERKTGQKHHSTILHSWSTLQELLGNPKALQFHTVHPPFRINGASTHYPTTVQAMSWDVTSFSSGRPCVH